MPIKNVLVLFAGLATALAVPAPLAAQPQLLGAAAMMQADGAITREFLFGRWTDTNDCSNTVEFLADGSFVTSEGARGRWMLQGARLSFIGNQTITATVRSNGPNGITLLHDDGTVGGSTRCSNIAATPRRLTMPAMPANAQAVIAMSRPVARQTLIGTWTDNGDCSNTVTFFANGRFAVPGGGGTWTLEGERLTFRGSSVVGARARAVGQNRILLIHDDGSLGQSIRC